MTKTEQYGIRKATPTLPARDLLVVPHQGGALTIAHPAFGPNTYGSNIGEMQGRYSHSADLLEMTFQPATTSESISAAAYDFSELARPQIFNPRWLQAGRITKTREGVYFNSQDARGSPLDMDRLEALARQAEEHNGVWLLPNGTDPEVMDFAFVPYGFKTEGQSAAEFARSTLARGLTSTKGDVATSLLEIASDYSRGVYVWGFEPVKEPVSRVVTLNSNRSLVGRRLGVGESWGGGDGGCAFGVLRAPSKTA